LTTGERKRGTEFGDSNIVEIGWIKGRCEDICTEIVSVMYKIGHPYGLCVLMGNCQTARVIQPFNAVALSCSSKYFVEVNVPFVFIQLLTLWTLSIVLFFN
jgi:hypothetical protein